MFFKKKDLIFLADFVCALSVYMMLAEFKEDTGSPRNGIMYGCMTTCEYEEEILIGYKSFWHS